MNEDTSEFLEGFTKWLFKWGSILAAIVSYSLNKSVFWAFLHGVCGWFYLVYFFIRDLGPLS